MIKQGAKLVEHAQDILEELSAQLRAGTAPVPSMNPPNGQGDLLALTGEESSILGLLEPYPVHIDDLAQKAGMAPGKIASILLCLELKGLVDQAPGKRFSLTNPIP